jgi:hypothetical protein
MKRPPDREVVDRRTFILVGHRTFLGGCEVLPRKPRWPTSSTRAAGATIRRATDLLRDLLRIVASNWDFGPHPAFLKLHFGRDWRTIGPLWVFPARTHNPLVVCSNHTGPSCF